MKIDLEIFQNVSLVKVAVFGLLAVVVLYTLHYIGLEIQHNPALSQTNLEAFITNAGKFSWLVYIGILMLFVMSPLPSPVLTLVGGFIFHPLIALGLTLFGESLGACANFYIGRILGKGLFYKRRFPKLRAFFERYSAHFDFHTIFLLGLIPVGTSNITGYAAGLTNMKLREYFFPWISGVMILTVATTFLGRSAKNGTPYVSAIIIAGIILALLIIKFVWKKQIKVS